MRRATPGRLANIMGALAIAAVLAVSGEARAQQTPQQCAAIAEDAARLACYDSIYRVTGSAGDITPVVIESERMIPARPTGREPATMTVACEAGSLTVSFAFANQLVSNTGDIAPVTLQVDQNATAVRTLRADADNTALSFGTAPETRAFLDSLQGGRNLKVRMTPVRQRSVTVDFRLPEHADAIAALRAACGAD